MGMGRLSEWAEYWLEVLHDETDPFCSYDARTIRKYRDVYRRHMQGYAREEEMEGFDQERALLLFNRICEGQRIEQHRSTAHVIYHFLQDLIRDAPCGPGVLRNRPEPFRIGRKVTQRTFLLRKEDIVTLMTMEDRPYLIYPITAFATGIAFSEQASLRMSDLDRKGREIRVGRRMIQQGSQSESGWKEVSLQGTFRDRVVCYPEIYDGYLERWLRTREQWKAENPSGAWEEDFLFPERDGRPCCFHRFYKEFGKIRENFSVPVTMTGIIRTGQILARDQCGANERMIQTQYGIFELPQGKTR